jgi:hypothetical protein
MCVGLKKKSFNKISCNQNMSCDLCESSINDNQFVVSSCKMHVFHTECIIKYIYNKHDERSWDNWGFMHEPCPKHTRCRCKIKRQCECGEDPDCYAEHGSYFMAEKEVTKRNIDVGGCTLKEFDWHSPCFQNFEKNTIELIPNTSIAKLKSIDDFVPDWKPRKKYKPTPFRLYTAN